MQSMSDPDEFVFSAIDRRAGAEDELVLTSVGIDIGSSTSHLIFSQLVLERRGSRYETVERNVIRESNIMLTPFIRGEKTLIDSAPLREFIDAEYAEAGLARDEIDTGALVLTGLAVRRENAREIGEIFSSDAGRFVTVTAGDSLEATMAAYGSGAVIASQEGRSSLNIDIGGGTTKLAVCENGRVMRVTALDVGARIITFSDDRSVREIEPSGAYFALLAGMDLKAGDILSDAEVLSITGFMADAILETAFQGRDISTGTASLLRCPAFDVGTEVASTIFSGGVSEYVYKREQRSFGDLGVALAGAVKTRIDALGITILEPLGGIRATAVGASQHTVQVSGSTIYVAPVETLPLRNVPVIAPALGLTEGDIDPVKVASAIKEDVKRLGSLLMGNPVALAAHWEGSATYQRLMDFCEGLVNGLASILVDGHPLVLVSDGDVGGLIGMHLRQNFTFTNAIVSIDGVELSEFDFIDVGQLLSSAGAVPVVIKSLVFPTQ